LSLGTAQLIAARSLQGIGAALLVPGSLALISANFGKATRGQAIGTWSGFTSIAAGIGPVLGGWLVEHLSWRWIFFVNVPLSVAVLLVAWFRVPESRDDSITGRLDWLGSVLAICGLGGIVFGLIESGPRGLMAPVVILSFAIGVASLVAFVIVERHTEQPIVPLKLFKSSTFLGANLLTSAVQSHSGAGLLANRCRWGTHAVRCHDVCPLPVVRRTRGSIRIEAPFDRGSAHHRCRIPVDVAAWGARRQLLEEFSSRGDCDEHRDGHQRSAADDDCDGSSRQTLCRSCVGHQQRGFADRRIVGCCCVRGHYAPVFREQFF
jgi:hypothetical protein